MDKRFRRLLRGELRTGELPDPLDLSLLSEGLADLCVRSLGMSPGQPVGLSARDGRVEWGSCIVLAGTCVLFAHRVPGWAEGVTPDQECKTASHDPPRYAGFVHTHLPDGNG